MTSTVHYQGLKFDCLIIQDQIGVFRPYWTLEAFAPQSACLGTSTDNRQLVTSETCDRPILIVFPNVRFDRVGFTPCCIDVGGPGIYTVIISE